jgi:hypothetical protein
MNKSKSYPIITEDTVKPIKKSKSLSDIQEYEYYFDEFFEGDGQLGIQFTNDGTSLVVKKIIKHSVADETYGLYPGMIVVNVNNKDVLNRSYTHIENKIAKSWSENNRVYIQFKKPLYHTMLSVLTSIELLKYYDNLVELGAKTIEDLDYIETSDLQNMNMTQSEITRFKCLKTKLIIILDKYDLLRYYDDMVTLGAKDEVDLEFIEIDDLHRMYMSENDIRNFLKINPNMRV